jgi:hypothetical protein
MGKESLDLTKGVVFLRGAKCYFHFFEITFLLYPRNPSPIYVATTKEREIHTLFILL